MRLFSIVVIIRLVFQSRDDLVVHRLYKMVASQAATVRRDALADKDDDEDLEGQATDDE